MRFRLIKEDEIAYVILWVFRDTWEKCDLSVIDKVPPDHLPHQVLSTDHKWRVAANWLTDMEDHNEWMNEEDYEVDENGEKKTHKLRMTYEDMEDLEGGDSSSEKSRSAEKKKTGRDKRKRSPSPPPKNSKRAKKGGAGNTPNKGGASKNKVEQPEEDYSRDFDDPPAENTLTEIAVPKVPVKKLETDFQPVKGK